MGTENTAIGAFALYFNTTGDNNTANGVNALIYNTTGSGNTANGYQALFNNTSGSSNIAVGLNAGLGVTTASNVICIGANVAGNNVNNSCYIGNVFGSTSSNGVGVFVNSNGRLGTMTSSRRFKDEIKPMDDASKALFALKPVAFHYKKDIDPAGTPQLGLVAEEVEKVNPYLVVRDKEGKPYSVRYDQVNAMLLNEFLKEHWAFLKEQRKVEVQEKTIAELKSGMTALAATVKEQASQIQKVSAQLAAASPSRGGLEASKPAPQMVNNP
jgi:trimeric autotransporter adhesin